MKTRISIPVIVMTVLLLAACGGGAEPSEVVELSSATPDACSAQRLTDEVARVQSLMREFDDASQLASETLQDQLVQVIPSLQEIRRRAEDQQVPWCLAMLKSQQVAHMNTVIETLMGFMGGASPDALIEGVSLARTQHEDYNREMARLLGATYAPPMPSVVTAASIDTRVTVTNPGPGLVNMRTSPDVNAPSPGRLEAGETAIAIGITGDGEWIQIIAPDDATQIVWVYAALIQVDGDLALLPQATPAP
ncbi:MAG: SH3 domain-containing protein [Chloroflexota bacterium]